MCFLFRYISSASRAIFISCFGDSHICWKFCMIDLRAWQKHRVISSPLRSTAKTLLDTERECVLVFVRIIRDCGFVCVARIYTYDMSSAIWMREARLVICHSRVYWRDVLRVCFLTYEGMCAGSGVRFTFEKLK